MENHLFEKGNPMKRMFSKADKHTALMQSMAEKVGVDWNELVAENPEMANSFRHASLTCAQCKKAGECVEWQAEHDHEEHAPDYCLNRQLLDKLHKD
jgi:hypothetical protein